MQEHTQHLQSHREARALLQHVLEQVGWHKQADRCDSEVEAEGRGSINSLLIGFPSIAQLCLSQRIDSYASTDKPISPLAFIIQIQAMTCGKYLPAICCYTLFILLYCFIIYLYCLYYALS